MKLAQIIAILRCLQLFIAEYVPNNVTIPAFNLNGQCGTDLSPVTVVYEGVSKIETYPWLGVLYYPSGNLQYSTSVVLITVQMVIASAVDIDKTPKVDFRVRARVVLGRNCSNDGIKVRDYTYYPDYKKTTYSALALIQLETDFWLKDLRPICPPPLTLDKPRFYTIALTEDCRSSTVKIHEMAYINLEQCKTYYRKAELDVEKMWPTHTICAKALTGKECIWRNGAALVLRQNDVWSLVGFGIYGPGCRAPSRFLDYSQYRPWIRSSLERIGKPTITRLARNEIILRRSLSNIQRYGACDPEEVEAELFTDRTTVTKRVTYKKQRARYNFTIFANLEYSCVAFRVYHFKRLKWLKDVPYIRLSRYCMSPKPICYSFQFLRIDFAVEIFFRESVTYQVMAYGREIRLINMRKLIHRLNLKKPRPVIYKAGPDRLFS